MGNRLIIAGGRTYHKDRDYHFTENEIEQLKHICEYMGITEIVSGGATGADKCGENFAKECNIPLKVFEADWDTLGRKAGPIRNGEMAEYADALCVFPGNKGTKDMLSKAKKNNLRIVQFKDKDGIAEFK